MPRKRQKSLKAGINELYRKCRYCNAHRSAHFFNRHEAACKTQWIIRHEDRQRHLRATLSSKIESHDQLGGAMDCDGESTTLQLDVDPAVNVNSSDMPQNTCAEEPNPSK